MKVLDWHVAFDIQPCTMVQSQILALDTKGQAMNRAEFEALRDLPGKVVKADIAFANQREASPNLTFEQISVENSLGLDVVLNGAYKPQIPSFTFNFVVRGVGPICRIDVNGPIHRDQGRTHKHDLKGEDDPRLNLPEAIHRGDLEGMTPGQVWRLLCEQANIKHAGSFSEPNR